MNKRIVAVLPAYNEGEKTANVIKRFPENIVDEIVVINDGSNDNTAQAVEDTGRATVVCGKERLGMGFAVRRGLKYALEKNYDIVVVMAGNGKDDPNEIPRLVQPILEGRCDYVQGSRYLKGGECGKMPLHRLVFTKMYSSAVRILYGAKITDGTNGFRAYTTDILKDPRVNLYQKWLKESLEYYLSIKVLLLGYRVLEVPVSKIYPQNVEYVEYTKVKPFSGWLKRLAPLFLMRIGLRK